MNISICVSSHDIFTKFKIPYHRRDGSVVRFSPCKREVRVSNRSNSLQQVVANPLSNAWQQVLVLRVLGDGHITQSLVSHYVGPAKELCLAISSEYLSSIAVLQVMLISWMKSNHTKQTNKKRQWHANLMCTHQRYSKKAVR